MMKLLLLTLLFPASVLGQLQLPQDPVRFLALGDSYTIGQSVSSVARWPAQLGDSLASRGYEMDTLRIIATTGWRTDNLINAIKGKNLEGLNYNLVSLLIGVNNQYQGRPFIQYAGEFPALLDSAIRYAGGDRSKVFVVSIPDYAYTPFGQQSVNPGEISLQIDHYNEYSKRIADSMHITYFDITPISRLGLTNPTFVANDGLHPSGIQYTEWVKLLLSYIDQQTTGLEGDSADDDIEVTITPNPTTGDLLISIPEGLARENISFRVFNLAGKVMRNGTMKSTSQPLSVQNLPDGLYLVEIQSSGRCAVKKFIKKSS